MLKRLGFLSVFLLVLTCSCGKKQTSASIVQYDAHELCTKTLVEAVDDETRSSKSNVYITYDGDFVKTAIYQSISPLENVSSFSYEMYDNIKNIYSSLEGTHVIYYQTKDSLVLDIKYEYDKIDLELLRSRLGTLLDSESILFKADSLPVLKERFKSIELDGYSCEYLK